MWPFADIAFLPIKEYLKHQQNLNGVNQIIDVFFSLQNFNAREQIFQQVYNSGLNEHRFTYDVDIFQMVRFKKKELEKIKSIFHEITLCPTFHMVLQLFLNYTIVLSKRNYSINIGHISHLL